MTKRYDLVIGNYNREMGIQDKNRNGVELNSAGFRGFDLDDFGYKHFVVCKADEGRVYALTGYNKKTRKAKLIRIINPSIIEVILKEYRVRQNRAEN